MGNKPCPCPQTWCKHRYLPYLESQAYSSKYKQLLACGSVMVAPRIDYPDFFIRALVPGVHYVETSPDDDTICEDMIGEAHSPALPQTLTPLCGPCASRAVEYRRLPLAPRHVSVSWISPA